MKFALTNLELSLQVAIQLSSKTGLKKIERMEFCPTPILMWGEAAVVYVFETECAKYIDVME